MRFLAVEMKMKINEIFYSLQGEGVKAGTPAVFVRFSGCNLRCGFCDTEHQCGQPMTEEDILSEVNRYPAPLVVLTGGEPSLQITPRLIKLLHAAGKTIAVETNGTRPLPEGIDWITFSPKIGIASGGERIAIKYADEMKVVDVGQDLDCYFGLLPECQPAMCLQPCYVEGDARREENLRRTIARVKADPRWRLSLQTHRLVNIP